MSMTFATILAFIPEPVRLLIIGGLGWLGKAIFDLIKSKPQNRRDDFKVVSDTLFQEINRLSERLDKAEDETKQCENNHKSLTMQYSQLSKQHIELSIKYGMVIESNQLLREELSRLKHRIEAYEKEKLSVDDDQTRTTGSTD